MSTPQVKFVNVSKSYGENQYRALHNVNATFLQGEFVAIRGPSGCGKSTLLNLLAGIDFPSTGQVIFEEQDLNELSDEKKTSLRSEKIGIIFQFFNLLSTLTVQENVLIAAELAGKKQHKEALAQADFLLEKVGISHRAKNYPSQLSGGEMQRTAIARALVNSPTIILADEPTGNLDSENGVKILELLRVANEDFGVTVILATHSPEAAAYASRELHMKDGELIS